MSVQQALGGAFRVQRDVSAPPALWRSVASVWEGRVGALLAVLLAAVIVIGPSIAPYSPSELATGPPLQPPSSSHLLGTDQLGRDVLSRFLCGGRTVLIAPAAATTIAFLIGGGLGLLAAYRRGSTDMVLSRGFDLLMTLPPLLIVLVLIAGIGVSWPTVIFVVSLVNLPRVGRVVRGAALGVVKSDYVLAAEARGEHTRWILAKEILPNIADTTIAQFCLFLTSAIVFVATLSYLGLGAQPPSSDWGLMIAEARGFVTANPWPVIAPSLAIAALAVSFTLIGDAAARHLSGQVGTSLVDI